jgi:hypothetical protein
MLLSWIFRGFLIAAGFVASWFVAKDARINGVPAMRNTQGREYLFVIDSEFAAARSRQLMRL